VYDIVVSDNKALPILDKVLGTTPISFLSTKCLAGDSFGIPTNYKAWKARGVKCISKGRLENFVDTKDFTDRYGILGKWKVCTSKATVEGSTFIGDVRSYFTQNSMFIIEPNAICTQSYLVVNTFDNREEAENFIAYMKTRFFRYMLGLRVITQDINKEKFGWVPELEGYEEPPTEQELYQKFGLTEEEVKQIESTIKKLN